MDKNEPWYRHTQTAFYLIGAQDAPIFVEATASVSHTQYVLMLKIQRDGAGKEKTGTGGPCAQVSRHDLFVIQH
jgi:hypothetical protein